jgi:hypothetical protein
MSNTIQIKRSSTANSVPTASQLAQGELAVNLVDKKLYTKDNTNAVAEITPTNATNLTGTSTSNIQTSALASGAASSTTFLRGDRTWQTINVTPSTADVLAATAGASAGAVGTYGFFLVPVNATGNIVSGANLEWGSVTDGGSSRSGNPSGTWRLLGFVATASRFSLCLRIS